uniref:Small acidic protein n=1 Tax=Ciona intestinalis TaxID=7719 RepID=A0A1W2WPI0_CIOIN|nr:small acidic protein isoform X1 [Ciona intestinalis]XP_009857542.1 small acidic protein isoform X2 [Ciona intestinalis]|eukprot:XP_002131437.1 small acidic protein isoform X1 [Ciona intestinalis]
MSSVTATAKENADTDETSKDVKFNQQKLLRLLGGEKSKNAKAASQWISKSRTHEDGKTLNDGLEEQYKNSLNHKLTGKARRHVGLGFESNQEETSSSSAHARSRSRSPIRQNINKPQKLETDQVTTESKSNPTATTINKNKFYMQFKKSESGQ